MTKDFFLKIIIFLFILALGVGYFLVNKQNDEYAFEMNSNEKVIRYIPIGDSYTIGLGVLEEDRWPNILVKHLRDEGVNIELINNPAVSGYTVLDAISFELPKVKQEKPDFITVLIGANDNFKSRDVKAFKEDFIAFVDGLEKAMGDPKKIVLITIPDYTKAPAAEGYFNKGSYQELIKQYNNVIKEEGLKRGLEVVDLFEISQNMSGEEFYISDGLHPSQKGYMAWEKEIFPVVLKVLKTIN